MSLFHSGNHEKTHKYAVGKMHVLNYKSGDTYSNHNALNG
jgi:hypothetical protein